VCGILIRNPLRLLSLSLTISDLVSEVRWIRKPRHQISEVRGVQQPRHKISKFVRHENDSSELMRKSDREAVSEVVRWRWGRTISRIVNSEGRGNAEDQSRHKAERIVLSTRKRHADDVSPRAGIGSFSAEENVTPVTIAVGVPTGLFSAVEAVTTTYGVPTALFSAVAASLQ
jgi:hypothetical protein